MESVKAVFTAKDVASSGSYRSKERTKSVELSIANKNQLVVDTSLGAENQVEDRSKLSFQELYKSLSITAKEIVDKINERLKIQLPDGVQSLRPEDVTPEATAERIVNGTTALFDIYAKQNPSLEGEELLSKFLETIRGGIDEGYNDAVRILEGLGAFQFDGVREGIEKTKVLIEEKLKAYAVLKRKEMGLEPVEVATAVGQETSGELLSQVGGSVLNVRA